MFSANRDRPFAQTRMCYRMIGCLAPRGALRLVCDPAQVHFPYREVNRRAACCAALISAPQRNLKALAPRLVHTLVSDIPPVSDGETTELQLKFGGLWVCSRFLLPVASRRVHVVATSARLLFLVVRLVAVSLLLCCVHIICISAFAREICDICAATL